MLAAEVKSRMGIHDWEDTGRRDGSFVPTFDLGPHKKSPGTAEIRLDSMPKRSNSYIPPTRRTSKHWRKIALAADLPPPIAPEPLPASKSPQPFYKLSVSSSHFQGHSSQPTPSLDSPQPTPPASPTKSNRKSRASPGPVSFSVADKLASFGLPSLAERRGRGGAPTIKTEGVAKSTSQGLSLSPHSQTGPGIQRESSFSRFSLASRFKESDEAKTRRKSRATSVRRSPTSRSPTTPSDTTPTRSRPTSSAFSTSTPRRRASKFSKRASLEYDVRYRSRSPSPKVATSFDPFTSFIGRLGRISLTPRKKDAKQHRSPPPTPTPATGVVAPSATPRLAQRSPFVGFEPSGSTAPPTPSPRPPLPTTRTQQPSQSGHSAASSTSSALPDHSFLSLPPRLESLRIAPLSPIVPDSPVVDSPILGPSLPIHHHPTSSAAPSHNRHTSQFSSVSSRSSRLATPSSYRKPLPQYLPGPVRSSGLFGVKHDAESDDDSEYEDVSDVAISLPTTPAAEVTRRTSFEYPSNNPAPKTGTGRVPLFWQAMQSKLASPSSSKLASPSPKSPAARVALPKSPAAGLRSRAPTVVVRSISGSDTWTSTTAPFTTTPQPQRLAGGASLGASDYSSQSMLNLDIEGTSFSDLFFSGPRAPAAAPVEPVSAIADRVRGSSQAAPPALAGRRDSTLFERASAPTGGRRDSSTAPMLRKPSRGASAKSSLELKAKRSGSVFWDQSPPGSIFWESGLSGLGSDVPTLPSAEHLLSMASSLPSSPALVDVASAKSADSDRRVRLSPTTFLLARLTYEEPHARLIPPARFDQALPALPTSPAFNVTPTFSPGAVFAKRLSVAEFPTTPVIEESSNTSILPFLSTDPNSYPSIIRSKHVPALSLSSLTSADGGILDTFPSPPSTPLAPSPSFSTHTSAWASSPGSVASFSFEDDDEEQWHEADLPTPPSSRTMASPYSPFTPASSKAHSNHSAKHSVVAFGFGESPIVDELGLGLGLWAGVDGFEMCV